MLRSYKEIAERIGKVWGTVPSTPSLIRWSKMGQDPLPIKKIKPTIGGARSIVMADPTAVEQWALRRVA